MYLFITIITQEQRLQFKEEMRGTRKKNPTTELQHPYNKTNT